MSAPSPEAPDRSPAVTPLELFFDLVFVFAVSQLSHHLLANLSWRGIAETLVLLLAVYAVWFSTSWQATVVGPDDQGVRRMLLVVMALGLFANAAIPRAFSVSGWAFVVPVLLIQLGRTGWTLARAPDAVYREHYTRTLIWLAATVPLWLAGAAADPEARLSWWLSAAAIDQIGRSLAHPVPGRRLRSGNLEFAGGHMLERCRLFLLIALGETVLAIGAAVAAAPVAPTAFAVAVVALAGTVALWALGFGSAGRLTLRHVEETRDPVFASRHGGDVLTAMVAGLVAVAVANEQVIEHPRAALPPVLLVLLFGGPLLFLLAQGWYFRVVLGIGPRLRVTASAALLLGALVTATATATGAAALLLVAAVLALAAVVDRP